MWGPWGCSRVRWSAWRGTAWGKWAKFSCLIPEWFAPSVLWWFYFGFWFWFVPMKLVSFVVWCKDIITFYRSLHFLHILCCLGVSCWYICSEFTGGLGRILWYHWFVTNLGVPIPEAPILSKILVANSNHNIGFPGTHFETGVDSLDSHDIYQKS